MSPMASSSSSNSILPVSVSPLDDGRQREKERLIKGDEKAFKGSSMTKRGAYAAISYMCCAVLLILFNKAALSSYNFPSANVITLFQIICSCSFLFALRHWKIISFTDGGSLTTSDVHATFVPLKTLMRTLPLALTYLLYMLVTMESVRGVNVPMYTTLRRTTVVKDVISVGLIVLGAFIAGARDLSFDFNGYAVVFAANFTTAIYLATISRIGKSSGLNSFGLMWCNGIICGPILLFWTFIRGDLGMTMNFPYLFSLGFLAPMVMCVFAHAWLRFLISIDGDALTSHCNSVLTFYLGVNEASNSLLSKIIEACTGVASTRVVLLLSCILAFFLNYSIFLNTTLNSALTQTICGNLKDLFTIALGWIIFGGLPFDFFNVIGQCLGFVGSGLYAYYKLIGR
ncbi:hypothetical protein DKX38_010661 [Salix brachista]|uniref:Sugar phosphate transporter domain-containing protein n=1 Tax=Salix brachista TaxID=2182728 RepID=A0A5N5MDZ5_9ROSI|nr:hypothetical protein DKX38_010661 [Salix brachista]